jgi:hypothetical protein
LRSCAGVSPAARCATTRVRCGRSNSSIWFDQLPSGCISLAAAPLQHAATNAATSLSPNLPGCGWQFSPPLKRIVRLTAAPASASCALLLAVKVFCATDICIKPMPVASMGQAAAAPRAAASVRWATSASICMPCPCDWAALCALRGAISSPVRSSAWAGGVAGTVASSATAPDALLRFRLLILSALLAPAPEVPRGAFELRSCAGVSPAARCATTRVRCGCIARWCNRKVSQFRTRISYSREGPFPLFGEFYFSTIAKLAFALLLYPTPFSLPLSEREGRGVRGRRL